MKWSKEQLEFIAKFKNRLYRQHNQELYDRQKKHFDAGYKQGQEDTKKAIRDLLDIKQYGEL